MDFGFRAFPLVTGINSVRNESTNTLGAGQWCLSILPTLSTFAFRNAAHPDSECQTQLIFAGGSFVPTFLLETAATMSNPKPHLNPVFAIPYLPGFPLVPTLAN